MKPGSFSFICRFIQTACQDGAIVLIDTSIGQMTHVWQEIVIFAGVKKSVIHIDGQDKDSCVAHRRGACVALPPLWRRRLLHHQGFGRDDTQEQMDLAACVQFPY